MGGQCGYADTDEQNTILDEKYSNDTKEGDMQDVHSLLQRA